MSNPCPECDKILSAKAKRCSCGWHRPRVRTSYVDDRCHYAIGTRRCPLPGSICSYPYSANGPWYCSEHWRTYDEPPLAEAALRYAEENYARIIEERRDPLKLQVKIGSHLPLKKKIQNTP